MQSPLFPMIKRYYDLGLYTNDPTDTMKYVGNFVKANMITVDEYKQITNEDYVA